MKAPKLVGTYRLGVDGVRVYIGYSDDGGGASFTFDPAKGDGAALVVNCVGRPWKDTVSSLLHEALESLLHRRGSGYSATLAPREFVSGYLFVVPHQTFDQCCDFAGEFLADCLPDMCAAWQHANAKPEEVNNGA